MSQQDKIRYSVVVPVYNSDGFFQKLLDSIPPDLGPEFEVFIVDDCSTDATREVIERHPIFPRIHLLSTGVNSGPAVARNLGAAKASGKYLILFDADVAFARDTLQNIDRFLAMNPEVRCFTGTNSKDSLHGGVVSEFHALYSHYALGLIGEGGVASTWNPRVGVVEKALFDQLGGFDTRYRKADVEDYVLSKKISRITPILFTQTVQVRHGFGDLKATTKAFYRRSAMWIRLLLRTRNPDKSGHTRESNIPSLLLSGLIGLTLLSLPFFKVRGVLLGLVAAHFILNHRLFLFFLKEAGWVRAVCYMLLVIYFNLVAELGILKGLAMHLTERKVEPDTLITDRQV
jgi:glycosyltransferase involved in cell wall biosynthesis